MRFRSLISLIVLLWPGALPGKPVTRRNLVYGRAGDRELKMDARIPEGAGPFPAAILVHGGGWLLPGRKLGIGPLLKPLTQAGIAWFAVGYRTARGKGTIEDGIDDVARAVAYVREHAAEYQVDPQRLALIGESSGGHLAAMAALRGEASVRAFVGLSAPMDLAALFWIAKAMPQPFKTLKAAQLTMLSPITYARPGAPPFLLIHGTADLLVPFKQSERMCERMEAMHASCELYPVKGGPHGMRLWIGSNYRTHMVEWLQRQWSTGPVGFPPWFPLLPLP